MSGAFVFHPQCDDPTFVKSDHRITSLSIVKNPRHWKINVFSRGGNAGMLTVDAADGPFFVFRLLPEGMRYESFVIEMQPQQLYWTADMSAKNAFSPNIEEAVQLARWTDAETIIREVGFIDCVPMMKIETIKYDEPEPVVPPGLYLDPEHCEVCARQEDRIQFARCGNHLYTVHP